MCVWGGGGAWRVVCIVCACAFPGVSVYACTYHFPRYVDFPALDHRRQLRLAVS